MAGRGSTLSEGNCKVSGESDNNYDISKHCIDLYAEKSDLQYYGLRFGTLNGYAPITRTDVMINAMTSSALLNGEIKLYV